VYFDHFISISYVESFSEGCAMSVIKHMDFWFEKPPGSFVLEKEQALLDNLLPLVSGDVILQLGGPSDLRLLQSSTLPHKLHCSLDGASTPDVSTFEADLNYLPLQQSCLDCVVVVHALAYSKQPELVLQKLCWSLKPGGQMILFGFNRYSLWGLAKLRRDKTRFPWGGEFHTPWKVKRLAKRVGFHLVADHQVCFRGPAFDKRKWESWRFLEMVGVTLMPAFSGVYMLYLQKKAAGVTPLKMKIKRSHERGFNEYAEPTMNQKQ
jgi:SAM-dependent methyltransferase